jgi:hypothetical protein
MSDLADLGFGFHSEGVQEANRALDAVPQKAGAAERATDSLASASARGSTASQKMMDAMLRAVQALERNTTAAEGLSRSLDSIPLKTTAAEKATDALASAAKRGSAASQAAAQASQKMVEATARTSVALEQQTSAAHQAAEGQAAIVQAQVRSAAATAGMTGALERQTAQTKAATAAARAGEAQLGRLGGGAKLSAAQLQNLSFQLNDVITGLVSGQRPLQILGQQGGQVFQALQMGAGGVRGSLAALVSTLGPMAAIVLAVGAAVGVAAAAFKGWQEIDHFNTSLIVTGNYAGLTTSALYDMAGSVAKATDTTVLASRKTIEALAATGKLGGESIASLADAAQNYGRITGKNAAEFIAEYASMGDNLVAFAVKHEDVYHDLTLAQIKQIDLLVKQGQEQKAQDLLAADIDAASKVRAKEKLSQEEQSYGLLQQWAHNLRDTWTAAWDAILGIGRPMSATDKLGEAMDKLSADSVRLQVARQTPLGNTPKARAMQDAALAKDYAAVSAAQAALKTENDKAAAQAAEAKKQHDAIQKVFGDGKSTGSTARDQTEQQLAAAMKAELEAQQALTKNVEMLAALKLREIDSELKGQIAQVETNRAIKDSQKGVIEQAYRNAAAAKREAVYRDELGGLVSGQLDQQRVLNGYADRVGAAQATLAQNAAQVNAIADARLSRQQDFERKEEAYQDGLLLLYGLITKAELDRRQAALAAAQFGEALGQAEQNRVRAVREVARVTQAGLQNQLDVADSQALLVMSIDKRNDLELQILDIQQQIALSKANEAIAAAVSGSLEQGLAKARLTTLEKVQENERKAVQAKDRNLDGLRAATDALDDFTSAFRSHDWGRALGELARALTQLSGPSGLTAMLSGVGAFAALSQAINPSIASALGMDKKQQKNAGMFGLLGALVLGKSSNHGAGIDLATGQLSGGRRNDETETAARAAADAITKAQETLRGAGIALGATVTGLVIGSRDLSQVYLSNGRTITSAVGDVQAAAEAALRGVLQDATYASDAQKTLVESMVAAGKGFDDITAALTAYAAAQKIGGGISDQILQLTDPKAYDLKAVHDAAQAQRDAAKAAADAGYLTAAQLATINGQLETLEGLQIDQVMKRYVTGTNDALKAANDNVNAAQDKVDQARSALADAYSRQAQSIQGVIDRFSALSDSLTKFGGDLVSGQLAGLNPARQYRSARSAFDQVNDKIAANPGDEAALGSFQGIAESFLTASRAVSPDQMTYGRDLSAVRRATTDAQKAAAAQVNVAKLQLDALTASVSELLSLNASVISVYDAILDLTKTLTDLAAAQAAATQLAMDQASAAAAAATAYGSGSSAGLVTSPSTPTAPANDSGPAVVTTDPATAQAVTDLTAQVAALAAAMQDGADYSKLTSDILQRVTRDGTSLMTQAA